MTLATELVAVVEAFGTDVKALGVKIGDLSTLPTTVKTSVVASIIELANQIASQTSIDDTKGNGDTTYTWSADKIFDSIATAKAAVKEEILGVGASAALDTLKELADAIAGDQNFAASVAAEIANRVRYDQAQSLTSPQQAQARTNIGAASLSEVDAHLLTTYGDPAVDLLAAYNAAKA